MTASTTTVLRQHAEAQYASEIEALIAFDSRQRPPRWKMSPWAVATYLLGGRLDNGVEISAKYIGNPRIIEIAVATLATDRALLVRRLPSARCRPGPKSVEQQ